MEQQCTRGKVPSIFIAIPMEPWYTIPVEKQNEGEMTMDPINEIELEDCPVCRGAGYIEDEQGWCMYACCLNCGTETAHVSYKTPEERLEAARQAAYLWNIGKVIHNGMCD